MSMSMGQEEGEPVAEINVTPMVDVLLCLLIIFIVSSPAPPNEQIPLSVPKTALVQTPSDPNAVLVLSIDATGQARLGQTPLPAAERDMVKVIAENPKATTDGRLVVSADPRVPYGRVVRVMAAAHEAGIPEVGIASDRL